MKKFKVLVVANGEQWHNVMAEKFTVDPAGNLVFDTEGADPAIYAAGRWICASVVSE